MTPTDIKIAEFNYPLPDERIAKHPLAERDRCKLLVRHADGSLDDRLFSEVPSLLPSDAVLVYNKYLGNQRTVAFPQGVGRYD